ncbi:MAG: hypothetical protein OXC82_07925 [Rhodobacteraceae bacterium]|nr:hypothetical protein [Paracoccaceae bacterium]
MAGTDLASGISRIVFVSPNGVRGSPAIHEKQQILDFGLSGNGFSPVSEYYHSTSNTLRHSPGPVGIVPRDAVQLCQLRPAIRIAMDLPGHEAKLPAGPLPGPCRELSMGRVRPAG